MKSIQVYTWNTPIYIITYMHACIHRWCIVLFPCFTINVVRLVWVFSFVGPTSNTRRIVGDERSPHLPTLTMVSLHHEWRHHHGSMGYQSRFKQYQETITVMLSEMTATTSSKRTISPRPTSWHAAHRRPLRCCWVTTSHDRYKSRSNWGLSSPTVKHDICQ